MKPDVYPTNSLSLDSFLLNIKNALCPGSPLEFYTIRVYDNRVTFAKNHLSISYHRNGDYYVNLGHGDIADGVGGTIKEALNSYLKNLVQEELRD